MPETGKLNTKIGSNWLMTIVRTPKTSSKVPVTKCVLICFPVLITPSSFIPVQKSISIVDCTFDIVQSISDCFELREIMLLAKFCHFCMKN